jgi:chondroitin sulfate synthase
MEVVIGDILDMGNMFNSFRYFELLTNALYFFFRVVALYKSDYIGMNLSIKGWGKEDVDLYDRFLQHHELSIVRACDPDFIHVYHPVVCNKQLTREQQEMCESSKANNYLSTKDTAKIIIDNDILNNL